MSELVIDSVTLEALEKVLQSHLDHIDLSSVVVGVRCLVREDTLMVTVEGIKQDLPNLWEILDCLNRTLEAENLSQQYQVSIYWSVDGHSQELEQIIAQNKAKKRLFKFFNQDAQKNLYYNNLKPKLTSKVIYKNIKTVYEKKSNSFFFLTGISLIVILGGIYGLTRPCLIGQCPILKEVEQLTDETLNVLKYSPSESKMLSTKQKLEQSVNLLSSIHWWSKYYNNSLILKKKYTQELNYLLILISANTLENKVILVSKNDGTSVAQWKDLQKRLEQAITDLETIPQSSDLREIATKKIKLHQTIMDDLNEKLSNEEKAEMSFALAKQATKLAKERQNKAQNLADLELVLSTWKTVVKRLQEIPPRTSIYQPSRELLKTYIAKVSQADKRKNQEEIAIKIYTQAVEQAKLAQKAESKNQWSQAVTHWNHAVNYIKQIPQNTFQGDKSQALIPNYTLALNRAKTQLIRAIELQKLNSDLTKLCSNSSQVCNYSIDDRGIKINLSSDYIAQVWNTALQAKVQGNLQIQTQLLHHLSSFEYHLQGISDRTGKTIEVYNSQGILMALYQRRQ